LALVKHRLGDVLLSTIKRDIESFQAKSMRYGH
jgi:hypothetical protein